jgi:hypothetical protein
MSTAELASTVDAEVVETKRLTERQAKALDKQIRAASDRLTSNVEALWELLEHAAGGEIHVALGYSSWTAYVKEAVRFTPSDRIERKALVSLMSGRGMSQRAIAGTLGVDHKTVGNDLREGGENSAPDNVVGLDGKTYRHKKPEPEVVGSDNGVIDAEVVVDEEPARKAAEVVSDFGDEIETLQINVQAFKDVLGDELFPKARERIAQRYLDRLEKAAIDIDGVICAVRGDEKP